MAQAIEQSSCLHSSNSEPSHSTTMASNSNNYADRLASIFSCIFPRRNNVHDSNKKRSSGLNCFKETDDETFPLNTSGTFEQNESLKIRKNSLVHQNSTKTATIRGMKVLVINCQNKIHLADRKASFQEGQESSESLLMHALARLSLVHHQAADFGQALNLLERHRHDLVLIGRQGLGEIGGQERSFVAQLNQSLNRPCSIVAVVEAFQSDDLGTMESLLNAGYDKVLEEQNSESLWCLQLMQVERNEYQWFLRQEASNCFQIALDNVSDPVEIFDTKFVTQYVNLAYMHQNDFLKIKEKQQRVLASAGSMMMMGGAGGGTGGGSQLFSAICRLSSGDSTLLSKSNSSPLSKKLSLTASADSQLPLFMLPASCGKNAAGGVRAPGRRQSDPDLGSGNRSSNLRHCNSVLPVRNSQGSIINYITIRSNSTNLPHFESCCLCYVHNARHELCKHRHSLAIETPIQKIASIIRQAQSASNFLVAQDLQSALDILQTSDLYAAQRSSISIKDSDPATSDLIDGLLSGNRSFLDAVNSKRTKLKHSFSNTRSSLHEIPEDISESLEGDEKWSYDILHLEQVSNKRALRYLGLKMCDRFDILSLLATSETVFANWLAVIEDHYHAANHYHNATHAADVMQSSAYFLERDILKEVFSPMDEVGTLLASIIHDVDHPGKTNPFLINSRDRLAVLYNDTAVLESHHASFGFQVTWKDDRINIFARMKSEDYKLLRQIIIDMVLATEMAKHFEHLTKFMNIVQKKPLTSDSPNGSPVYFELDPPLLEDPQTSSPSPMTSAGPPLTSATTTDTNRRRSSVASQMNRSLTTAERCLSQSDYVAFLGQPDNRANLRRILIKCSDISNPTRPLPLCREWARRIAEEYFDQTDEEKAKQLPVVMPWFDRATCNIAESQVKFVDFFLRNMMDSWHEFLVVPELMDNLQANYQYWSSLMSSPLPTPSQSPAPAASSSSATVASHPSFKSAAK